MNISFKNPDSGDIGWLISIHGKIYFDQFNFNSQFEIDIAKKVVLFFEKPKNFDNLWIAQVGNKRIGSIAVSLKPDKTAFINFLLVKPEYRNRGIACRLMDKAVTHTMESGLKVLRLETYSCLKDARKLYQKYGFKCYKNESIDKYGHKFQQEFWEKEL